MSHLSILPTVLRDAEALAATLASLELPWRWGGELVGFAGERQAVTLQLQLRDGQGLGWVQLNDGSLALVGDLQRISRNNGLQRLLGRITRAYAARAALQEASLVLPTASIELRV
ncbi:DUF1257 domain-containing protein [Cyanobium sp. N.Huapi 1H5]|uniref:DUF1257 domain-containing protein n=1 Tax=Cyanobium sp. N.Huapi 1H5 TaxID=2823719 RepID=UPI0020CC01EF|nr:DUF1257 domain-containing protein [Cyanobium sp. N.Huapi 1H5]MCP9836815.1 DUF1257 domain-containing protein [Cyanobium sp. N.Huapi 1H5]